MPFVAAQPPLGSEEATIAAYYPYNNKQRMTSFPVALIHGIASQSGAGLFIEGHLNALGGGGENIERCSKYDIFTCYEHLPTRWRVDTLCAGPVKQGFCANEGQRYAFEIVLSLTLWE